MNDPSYNARTSQAWRDKNREYVREYDRWRSKLKYVPKTKKVSPEERKARRATRMRVWRQKNRELYREQCKIRQSRENVKYRAYGFAAKKRNLEWALNQEQFSEIIHSPCVYCGDSPALGVDRVINNIGYTPENSAPCCSGCNYAKHKKSVEEFLCMVKKIAILRLNMVEKPEEPQCPSTPTVLSL